MARGLIFAVVALERGSSREASRGQVLLVGDSSVGKSSLLMRFTADQYDDHTTPTIGKEIVWYV